MFEDRTVLRVGAVVSILLVAAVVFALQIDLRDLGPTAKIDVFLSHPGALRADADVQLGGRKIGTVHAIRLVTSHEARSPDHPLYPDGGVVCQVWVRNKYLFWVRGNSELFVNSRGLIGESYLEVAPPPGDEEMLRPVRTGDRLRGIDPARMEHVIVTSFDNARRFAALLEELGPSMQLFRDELTALGTTIDSLQPEATAFAAIGDSAGRASDEMARLREGFADYDLEVLQVQGQRLIAQARSDLAAIDAALDILSRDLRVIEARLPADLTGKYRQVASDAQTQLATLRSTIATLRELAQLIEQGSGTIGALMNDPEFSDDAKKLGRYLKRHPWKLLTR